ncbi:MAG: hypothetical protein R3E45_10980 [Rhodocyclaceae bacterium]
MLTLSKSWPTRHCGTAVAAAQLAARLEQVAEHHREGERHRHEERDRHQQVHPLQLPRGGRGDVQGDDLRQPGHVFTPAAVADRDRVEAGQRPQRFRQLLGARHRRALDQHRIDRHGGFERGGDLAGDPVVGLVEAPPASAVARIEPVRADQHHHRVGTAEGMADDLAEIRSAGNALDIAEHALVTEVDRQRIGQPASGPLGVAASIADEDALHLPARGRHAGLLDAEDPTITPFSGRM